MECYLDNSATTCADKNVIDTVVKVMGEDFGNPSSKHMKGVESEAYLKQARETIAEVLHVSEKEIIFTSGGTESNNMALIGVAMAGIRKGRHIITTCFEHASVLEPLKYLNEMKISSELGVSGLEVTGDGFEITYLGVDHKGHISREELENAIRPDTILVSVMMVNNEIGAVQDVSEIGRIIKEKNPKTLFHVDAIQAFGKFDIAPRRMNIDLLSVSSHKFHGPKGVGFLYVKEGVKIKPLILGGGQQKGMRSGTDNVPGIAGMAVAAKIAKADMNQNVRHMTEMKNRLIDGLNGISCPGLKLIVNSYKDGASAPHIVSASFYPIKSEVLLHALEERGIYVSSGSACSSNKPGLSGTLQSIGLSPKEADCTLRFSFSRDTSEEEIDYTLDQLKELLPVFSKFVSH